MSAAPSDPGGAFETSRLQVPRARSKAAGAGVFVVFVRLNIGIMMTSA
jgi:hypothetical protein